ncbi:MAG TPA: putative toxin-antitoxin system toxin component, PIN family [Candidatus Acidoferrum sp.]|nr:putative toxin-antitoxin system toxin component, PIN family [Candidatus Acidoferrum sp.]
MRVVIDADCLIAGVLAVAGAASRLLDLWRDGAFELIACPQLVGEVRKALLDPRISRRYGITLDEVDEFCRRIEEDSIWLADPIDPPRMVRADAGDDYLIQFPKESRADALVTRDHHFEGIVVRGLEILPPRAILPRLSA